VGLTRGLTQVPTIQQPEKRLGQTRLNSGRAESRPFDNKDLV